MNYLALAVSLVVAQFAADRISSGPVYDCGDPECQECQRAFGPDRSAAIARHNARAKYYATLRKPAPPLEAPYGPDEQCGCGDLFNPSYPQCPICKHCPGCCPGHEADNGV